MPSFRGIQEDCEKIVDQLRVKLREMLADDKASLFPSLCVMLHGSPVYIIMIDCAC